MMLKIRTKESWHRIPGFTVVWEQALILIESIIANQQKKRPIRLMCR